MKILVTFALETEFAPWRRLRSFEPASGRADAGYEARVGDAAIRVVLTGVGEAHARRAVLEALIEKPDAFIVSGLAGSLKPSHRPGDVLVAVAVHETGGTQTFRSEAVLVEMAAALGARRVPTFVTVDRMLLKAEEKKRLGSGGDAVDMESFAAMSEAVVRNIPAIAIRAISDAVDEDLPLDFSHVLNERGGIQLSRVVSRLALAPHRLPALLRLSRSSRRAAEKLGRFLDAYVTHLSKRVGKSEPLAEAVAI